MTRPFCRWCGCRMPEHDEDDYAANLNAVLISEDTCLDCLSILKSPLDRAKHFFDALTEDFGGKVSAGSIHKPRRPDDAVIFLPEPSEYYLVYAPGDQHDEGDGISVEVGVFLYHDAAQCFWVFDNDSTVESFSYGECIDYKVKTTEQFLAEVSEKWNLAAADALSHDILSCDVCGYHYHFEHGPCCQPESDEES